jgi:hypothetical protein
MNFTDKEQKEIDLFNKEHEKCISDINATEGNYKVSYIITPNGLGYLLEIRCNVCNKIKDITDSNGW